MNLANQNGADFRSDANNALAALVSNSSGTSEPSTTFAYQFWADTTSGNLKIRNGANNAWIVLGSLSAEYFGIGPTAVSTSAPSSPIAGQFWLDSDASPRTLYIRNYNNTSWVELGRADDANLGLLTKVGGTMSGAILYSNTDHTTVPAGTTAQRAGSPVAGSMRFNTTLTQYEGWNGTAWLPIGGGGYEVTAVQTVTAAGDITSSTTAQRQLRHVKGDTGGVSASTTPFGNTGGWKDGTEILLVGNDDADTLTLTFNDAAKGLVGNFDTLELTKYKTAVCVYCSTLDRWILQNR